MGPQKPIGKAGSDTRVDTKADPRGQHTSHPFKGAADPNDSTAPSYVAPPGFKRSVESAVRQEKVPPAYRRQVKSYFDGLQGR